MTVKSTMAFVGLDELLDALKQLPQELVGNGRGQNNPVYKALDAASEPVLSSMKNLAPYDTGRLRGAIRKERHRNPRYLNEIVGVGVDLGKSVNDENGAWYGYIVEHDTGFMKRAAEKNKDKFVSIFTRELSTRIEKVAKKVGNENARKVAAKVKASSAPLNDTQALFAWRPRSG